MVGAAALTTLGALPVFLVSAQSVLMRDDLRFSEAQLGLAVSLFFGSAAAAAWSAGRSVEVRGSRQIMIGAGLTSMLSVAGIALAPGYWLLPIAMVLAGLANAALAMAANVAMATVVPAGRRGLAFGVKQAAVPTAILIGGAAVPTIGVVVGWRWPFAVTVLGGLVVFVLALVRRGRPQVGGNGSAAADGGERAPAKGLVYTAAAMTLASMSLNALGAFLPAWAFDVGLSPGQAGVLIAAASALAIAARIGSGWAADRRNGRNLPVVGAQMVVGGLSLVALAAGTVPLLIVASFAAIAIGWSWPGLLLFAVARVGRDSPGGATAAVQSGAWAGGAAGPLLFGLLVSWLGYPVSWLIAAAAMLVAAGLLMVARRIFRADVAARPLVIPR